MKKILIALAFLPFCSAAQPVKNLVFEGAGIRGIAYAGVIGELERKGTMAGVQRIGGTSSGAITALLLSMGYSAGEIRSIVQSTPFRKFNDGKFFFIGGISRLRSYFGWYRGYQFEKWLSQLIKAKTGDPDISFRQLHEKGFKQLYITGTCLNRQSLVVFSHENYPDMKVRDAVRISMSIPLYFEAVFVDAAGRTYRHPKNREGLDVMVDGGFLANFPIRIFDSTRYTSGEQPNRYAVNPETLGFRIDRERQIENDKQGGPLASWPVGSLRQYFGAFYNIVIENLNRQTLTKEDWQRTISIDDGDIGARVRTLSPQEVNVLVENGRKAMN